MITAPPPRCDHVRDRHVRQPDIAADVRAHHPLERLIGHPGSGPEIRIHPGVLHQDVDPAALRDGLIDQVLQFLLARDMARDDHRLAARRLDLRRHRLARIGLAAGDHDGRAVLGHARGDREADPLGGPGYDRDLAGQIEQR